MNLRTARALITGGAGGIGSAIATELLQHGATVLLADMNAPALTATARRLPHGERVTIAAVDLTEAAARAALCAQAVSWRVNVLVNNAGVNHFALFEDLTAAQLTQTVALNVMAPMLLAHGLLPHLREQAEAHVLNVGSVFGNIGYPGYSAYSASKFAIRGFSEALRRELTGTRVRVHYLAPRATRTPINAPAVVRMNAELKVAMDAPEAVARAARRMLEKDVGSAVVGWPEKLLARLNGLAPEVVDAAIARQLPIIRKYARDRAEPATAESARSRTA